MIDRAGDGTGRAARNAACVLGIVIGVRINRAPVDAGFDGPLIAPCNAADVGHTGDLSLIFTLPQHAGGLVDPHQTAHILLAGDRTGDGHAGHRALVPPAQKAQPALGALGQDLPFQLQIPDHRLLFEVAEQALVGPLARDPQAADAVSVPLKDAAKDGNGPECGVSQVDVRRELYGEPLAPGVQRAAFRQCDQLPRRTHGDRPPLRGGGGAQSQRQAKRRQEGNDPFTFPHACSPPRLPAPAPDTCSRSGHPHCPAGRP